jgi:hypothetical protein
MAIPSSSGMWCGVCQWGRTLPSHHPPRSVPQADNQQCSDGVEALKELKKLHGVCMSRDRIIARQATGMLRVANAPWRRYQ